MPVARRPLTYELSWVSSALKVRYISSGFEGQSALNPSVWQAGRARHARPADVLFACGAVC